MAPMRLAGRCANGFERGRGVVFHALPDESRQHGQGTALCGKRPGRRSAGWVDVAGAAVTCPSCLRRLAAGSLEEASAAPQDAPGDAGQA